MRHAALGLGAALLVTPALAQGPPADQRCVLELERPLLREGTRIEVAPGIVNFFGGGDVRFRCRNQNIRMRSDSVASYQGSVVQFVGRVHYRDSTLDMTADFGTYFRDNEKWEARGNVVLRNLANGTILRGPMLDYYRQMRGFRDSAELYADQRPTITVPVRDSTGAEDQEPYVVVGDRVRTRGNDRVYAGGRVTVDRSDFRGRGDSLFLEQAAGNGALIGQASLRRTAADSFDLTGRRIDLRLEERELTYVLASDSARLRNPDLQLDGDVIGIDVNARKVEQTLAWGKTVRPLALSQDFEIRGDSLAFDTPGQALREVRAFGGAWVGAKPDSGTGDRDWIAGDTVVAAFAQADSADTGRAAIRQIEARGRASALYRLRQQGQAQASLTYNKADLIRIAFSAAGDSTTVDSVFVKGNVEGIHLQPAPPRRAPTDTTRADTTRARPLPPRSRR